MKKGNHIHCKELARTHATDSHQGLTVTLVSPSLLRLRGALDVATRNLMQAMLGDLSTPDLHLDVSGLEFADAAGLDVLARADADRHAKGHGRVVLHGSRPFLQRTLIAAGLQRLLPWGSEEDDDQHWRPFAVCRDAPVSLFFEDDDPLPARRLCWSCPVSGNCLSYALRTQQSFGVWGGLTAPERAVLQGPHAVGPADRARGTL